MSCFGSTFINYFKGDNQPLKITIKDQDGARIPGIQTDTVEIEFQAQSNDGMGDVIFTLLLSSDQIQLDVELDDNGVDQDVATVLLDLVDYSDIEEGRYPIFMKITLNTPAQYHLEMKSDDIELKQLNILNGVI